MSILLIVLSYDINAIIEYLRIIVLRNMFKENKKGFDRKAKPSWLIPNALLGLWVRIPLLP